MKFSDKEADLFRAAFETAGIAMAIIGQDLDESGPTIDFANAAMTALTGYASDELIGRSPRLVLGPETDPAEVRRGKRTLVRNGTYCGKTVNYRKDGSTYVAGWNITAIPDAGGDVRGWFAIHQDETERRRLPEPQADADTRPRALLDGIAHLVWQSRDHGDWCAAGPQWTAFTGQSEAASVGAGWRNAIDHRDLAITDQAWRVADETGVLTVDHRIRRHDGIVRWFQTRALPVPADAPHSPDRLWIGTSTDIDDLRTAEQRIRHLAFHDTLTNVGNRGMLHDVLSRMTLEQSGPSFNLLCFDIDDFKLVNDQVGHRGGDEVLREISRRLGGSMPDSHLVARIGGDEFVVVQADAQADDGSRLAEGIMNRMAEPFVVDGKELRVSSCLGIASFPSDSRDADELLRQADLALYDAKAYGSGYVRHYQPALETDRQKRLVLRTGLLRAVDNSELEIAYQVIRDVRTGALHGHEALARWTHPELGAVSPATFIPLAEETGLIVPIGRWVLERACRDASEPALGLGTLAVNLSPVQFRTGTLAREVEDALDRAGLPPGQLELEVTERLLMDNTEQVDRTLREIRELGVRIALDDFGTGYSNLGYLCRFPFDRLKIDRSFVHQMVEDEGARAVVRGIVALAHSLRLQVTAEGVETEQQLALLREMGCDQVQGFLLGRPSSASMLRRD